MKPQRIRIFLEDECPRIGCGWRTVEVKAGRKWVHFRDPFNGNKCRLPKAKAEFVLDSIRA